MAKDDRPYVQVDVGLPNNRKLRGASVHAKWLYASTLLWCGLEINDGIFRPRQAAAYADVADKHVQELVDRDLWHEKGHACLKCPQPTDSGDLVVHDYHQHNRTAETIRKLRAGRKQNGKRGIHTRWRNAGHADHQCEFEECSVCSSLL